MRGPPDRDRPSQTTPEEQRYRLLYETSRDLTSSLDLDEVLQSAARRLGSALWHPRLRLLPARERRQARLRGVERQGSLRRHLDRARVPPARVGTPRDSRSRSARSRRREPGRPAPGRGRARVGPPYGQRSFIVLPLVAHDTVIGMIELLDHVERRFTDEEIAVAEAVAKLVALAIDNAQLYEEIKRHAPRQPQGPELGAQRQGLLHARPRRRVAAYTALLGKRAGLARASA